MSLDPEAVQAALSALDAEAAHADPEATLPATLGRLVDSAARVTDVDGAGLMLIDAAQVLRYVAASDAPGRQLEEAQEQAGDGPCVRAFVEGVTVSTPDAATDARWPSLAAMLRDSPVHAVVGVAIRLGGLPVGTLNVYREAPHVWTDAQVAAVEAYAHVGEHLVATAVAARRAGTLAGQLQRALDQRVVIDRAVGYLMARGGLDAVGAFDQLRRTARSQRRKVADLAADVLSGQWAPHLPVQTEPVD